MLQLYNTLACDLLFFKMPTIYFLFQLLAFSLIIFIFFFPRKKSNLPPGPRGLPFIGNLHQYDDLHPHLFLHELSKKYGPFMSMKLGNVPVIVISSARLAKDAFITNDIVISSRPKLTGQQKLTYNRVDIAFSPYNDYWREMRKITVTHLFNRKQVNSFSPIRQDEVCHMVKDISKKANNIQVINLSETLISLSSSVLCRAVLGKSYTETSSFKRTFDEVSHEADAMLSAFFFADYIPWLGWIDKVTGMTARLDKCFKDLDSFFQELINEHLSPNRPLSMEGDILDLFIQLKEENTTSIDINWDHIKAILMNIFVAGTGTSPAVITWALTCLVKTPITMKKVQDEIREIVGKKGRVDEDDIQKLPYLKAVIKEAMRLYPPGPLLIPRETTRSCLINGYEIQPKTMVYINFWSIGKDPECWENPNEFFPDRFLNITIDYKGKDFELIPFGSGRRICPGMSLGIALVELALANLLYSFDWELPVGMTKEDIDTHASTGIVMHKKNPLFLMAKSYIYN